MPRYALLGPDNRVANIVEAEAGWQPPVGHSLVPATATVSVGDAWSAATGAFTPVAASAAERRAAKLERIQAERDALKARGAPYAGKRVDMMGGDSRSDLVGMATTAGFALNGVLPWPEDYAKGWIAIDNSRIPLPTPQAGILLAATVAVWYAGVIQRARDLKDAVLAATDPDSVAVEWAPFDGE